MSEQDVEILRKAQDLNNQADKTGDPDLYIRASNEYRKIGWYMSAISCENKAAHYYQIRREAKND